MKSLLEWFIEKKAMTEKFLTDFWNKVLDATDIAARKHKLKIEHTTKSLKKFDLKKTQGTLNHLAFQTLGSKLNREDFVLADIQINAFKARAWDGKNVMDPDDFTDLLKEYKEGESEAFTVFSPIRAVSSSIGYRFSTTFAD